MTAVTARDRLLQAIDSHNNVSNMVVVLDVISFLEEYPITKEALEETRLGKLINDIRRKTQNADLAKRAKRLLRGWQKLIMPGSAEVSTKTDKAPWSSSNGSSHPHICSSSAPSTRKTACELKSRNDFNNCKARKKHNKRRKVDHYLHEPTKISEKILDRTHRLKISNSNGINDLKTHGKPVCLDSNRPLSTSLLLKASVMQQQAASRGQCTNKATCSSLRQEIVKKIRQQPHTLSLSKESASQKESECLKSSSYSVSKSVEKQTCLGRFEDSKKAVKLKEKHLVFNPITCQMKCNEDDQIENVLKNVSNEKVVVSSSVQLSDKNESTHERKSAVFRHVPTSEDEGVLLTEGPADRPGVSRHVTAADVHRLHSQRWAGVNGCLDPMGHWSDWTQSFSIDLGADGSRLDVLPYVCLD